MASSIRILVQSQSARFAINALNIPVLPLQKKLQVVNCLLNVLPTGLELVAADVFQCVRLAPPDLVAINKLAGLYRKMRIVIAPNLLLTRRHARRLARCSLGVAHRQLAFS